MAWKRGQPAPDGLTAGHLVGTIILIAAPGNFVRAGTMGASPVADRIEGVIGNLGSLFDPYWIAATAVVALSYLGARNPSASVHIDNGKRAGHWPAFHTGRGWAFLVLALCYMATLLGLPRSSLAARVSFPASVFLICYLATVFRCRPVSETRDRAMVPVLLILFGIHLAIVVPDLIHLARIHRAWASATRSRTGSDVTLPVVRVKGRTLYVHKDIFFEGFTSDPEYFVNQCYAEAMHVKSITAK